MADLVALDDAQLARDRVRELWTAKTARALRTPDTR